MSSKLTAKGYCPNLSDEQKSYIDANMKEQRRCVMSAFNRMIRPTNLTEIIDGKEVSVTRFLKKDELERFLQLKYNLNSREVKDAIKVAREIIVSKQELLPEYIENLENKIRGIDYKLKNYDLKKYQISGYERKKQKLLKELKMYQEHVENGTVPGAIFGGKDNFKARSEQGEGQMSREDFLDAKYGNYVSRGDATKGGNPHLRIVEDNEGNTKLSAPMYGRYYTKKVQEEQAKIREEKLKNAKTPEEIKKIDKVDINEVVRTKNTLPPKRFKRFETDIYIPCKKSKIVEKDELDNTDVSKVDDSNSNELKVVNTKDSTKEAKKDKNAVDSISQELSNKNSKSGEKSNNTADFNNSKENKENKVNYRYVGTNYKQLVLDYIKTGKAYKMEFLRRKGKYYCHITFEPEFPTGKGTKELGILGIDVNPDGIAITIIFPDGNYKYHEFIKCPEMLTASANKRNNLAGDLAHRICKNSFKI